MKTGFRGLLRAVTKTRQRTLAVGFAVVIATIGGGMPLATALAASSSSVGTGITVTQNDCTGFTISLSASASSNEFVALLDPDGELVPDPAVLLSPGGTPLVITDLTLVTGDQYFLESGVEANKGQLVEGAATTVTGCGGTTSPSPTPTVTITITPSPTITVTPTPTPTITITPTPTITVTPTPTPTTTTGPPPKCWADSKSDGYYKDVKGGILVTVGGKGLVLCQPIYAESVGWTYVSPTSMWPQDHPVAAKLIKITKSGTYFIPAAKGCQVDFYAAVGKAPAYPKVLTGPGKPYEPKFVSDYFTGTDAVWFYITPAQCQCGKKRVSL